MYYLIDNKNCIIFGWSAKCGCSHIKSIFWFLQNDSIENPIHTNLDINNIPDNIEKYTTIIICRNPYKRLVSGFLDKYNKNGSFRHLWKNNELTFTQFVNEIIKRNWSVIEEHHFIPQTEECFDIKLLKSKCIKCYDIENIDYKYIEGLYNKEIPNILINKKYGHERLKYNKLFNDNVYDLDMDKYYNYDVDIKLFYNDQLKNDVFNFYKKNFDFFNNFGINYNL